MDSWNPDKYLQFKNERTQPSIDLAEKIELKNPKSIIDIGCGPGNSTQVLVNKWPDSIVVGLDSSKAMIEKAKKDYPDGIWINADAENMAEDKKYSVVFSNAALQWMPRHEILIPKLWNIVDEGGAFAAQIPRFEIMPANIAINAVLEKKQWRGRIDNFWGNKEYHEPAYYYELLSAFTDKITLWETHYYHILPSLRGIVDFLHSTALKPYLEKLDTDNEKSGFENDIFEECKKYYKEQSNGKVLFPFHRMFMIAYK